MSKIYDNYLELKKQNDQKLYLFECGKFYIFLDKDCDYINEFMVLAKTKFSNECYKCGFPIEKIDLYKKVFDNHKLDIEIIENKETHLKKKLDKIKNLDIEKISAEETIKILLELKELL